MEFEKEAYDNEGYDINEAQTLQRVTGRVAFDQQVGRESLDGDSDDGPLCNPDVENDYNPDDTLTKPRRVTGLFVRTSTAFKKQSERAKRLDPAGEPDGADAGLYYPDDTVVDPVHSTRRPAVSENFDTPVVTSFYWLATFFVVSSQTLCL